MGFDSVYGVVVVGASEFFKLPMFGLQKIPAPYVQKYRIWRA